MHEHAETQIHKPLLQIEERPSTRRSDTIGAVMFSLTAVIAGQDSSGRRLGSKPEKLSSCRHSMFETWVERVNDFLSHGGER